MRKSIRRNFNKYSRYHIPVIRTCTRVTTSDLAILIKIQNKVEQKKEIKKRSRMQQFSNLYFANLSRFPAILRDLMLRFFYIIVIFSSFTYYETRSLMLGFYLKIRVMVEKASKIIAISTLTENEIQRNSAAQRDTMCNGNIK